MKIKDIVFFLIVVGVISFIFLGLGNLIESGNKSNREYLKKQNSNIMDCQSRGNTIEWCLSVFNK